VALTVTLRDSSGEPVIYQDRNTTYFSIFATGQVPIGDGSTSVDATIRGGVTEMSPVIDHDALYAQIEINVAGEWEVNVMEGPEINKQHVGNSPFTLTVKHGTTSASTTFAEVSPTVPLGENATISMQPVDSFYNPTFNTNDGFYYEWTCVSGKCDSEKPEFDEKGTAIDYKKVLPDNREEEGSIVFSEGMAEEGLYVDASEAGGGASEPSELSGRANQREILLL
jgi:hypothetical protein